MKTKITIMMAALLLTACGVRHETKSIDTSLILTEDSISFDVCSDWRIRNAMGVWVDSLGSVYLNHDMFDNPPPPPPPGEYYEYVDDREPCDIGLLREKVKLFFSNPDDDPNLPEKILIYIPTIGEYPVCKGCVSILTLDGAPESTVDRVRHEIAAAVIELRDSLSLQLFGLHYGDLPADQATAIRDAIPTSTYYSTVNRFFKIASDDE